MAPLNRDPRSPGPNRREVLYITLAAMLLIALLVALALVLEGCAVSYDGQRGYRAVLGCVNLTGPGITLACPQDLKAPELPDSQVATPPPAGN